MTKNHTFKNLFGKFSWKKIFYPCIVERARAHPGVFADIDQHDSILTLLRHYEASLPRFAAVIIIIIMSREIKWQFVEIGSGHIFS